MVHILDGHLHHILRARGWHEVAPVEKLQAVILEPLLVGIRIYFFLRLILIFGQISHLMILLGGLIVFIHSAIHKNDQEKVAILSKSKELLISVSMLVNNIYEVS